MNLTLYVWRQKGPKEKGRLVRYAARDITPDMSFLEMLDVVNEELITKGEDPVAFDHDCREGICGMCAQVINGIPRDRRRKRRSASSICATSRTATRSISNRCGRAPSRSSGTWLLTGAP